MKLRTQTVSRLGAIGVVAAAHVLAMPLASDGPCAATVPRIGILEMEDESANAANLQAFRQGLQELGHVEGQSFAIEYRSAKDRPERFGELAAELVRLRVDVIVTRGEPAAFAAKRATSTIPVVMASSSAPAVSGIVSSLARPGGNVTGFHTLATSEAGGRRLELLREMVPGLSRIGLLWNPADTYTQLIAKATEAAARAPGVQLKSLEWQKSTALERVFETALMDQVDGLVVVEDYQTFSERVRIVDFAARSRLPAIYGLREYVDAGGLMSYGTDRRDLYRRCAGYVHRILNGTKPADLPVEGPIAFELAINLGAARAIGLTIPPALLARASYIVK